MPDTRRRLPARLRDGAALLFVRVAGRVLRPVVLRLSHRRDHRGFRILTFLPSEDGMNEAAAARITLALDLIAACDPRRFARIRRDMPNIRVIRTGGGLFDPTDWTCVVDWTAVMWQPVAHLAETIVHEATHARLSNRGVRPTARNLARVERRCCAEQVDFLRRLPPECAAEAARSVAWIEQCLAAPEPWYGRRAWALRPLAPATRRRVEEDRARGV